MTLYIILVIIAVIFVLSFVTVNQGSIAVITMFGKYKRIMSPGLSLKIPFFEMVHKRMGISFDRFTIE